jgi:hypothetical protein
MAGSQLDPPSSEEVEVSIFGPGYGEAIALHIGEGKWILVDSCLEPDSNLPASLHYLHSLNVDVEGAVKLIVATHWHDDHIRGISNVLNDCRCATVCISTALDAEEFLALTSLYDKPVIRRDSGLNEFIQVLRTTNTRKERGVRFCAPKFALADRTIFQDKVHLGSGTVETKMFSLSPSDASVLKAKLAFAMLQEELGPGKRVAPIPPNHASVVLWLEVGHHKVLLGSDLEVTADPKTGWSVIVNESMVVSEKAGVFKIPHHGSKNAHFEDVWSKLLLREPFAILTPFRLGGKTLPTPRDVTRICQLTSRAYATAPPRRRRQKWHQRVVRDFVKEMTRDIRNVHSGWGHVRLRNNINQANQPWQVELFGDAYMLSLQ